MKMFPRVTDRRILVFLINLAENLAFVTVGAAALWRPVRTRLTRTLTSGYTFNAPQAAAHYQG